MEMIRMKTDVQQAIANNFNNFETSYSSLIFEENTLHLAKTFAFYDTLKIYVKDNKLNFKIKLNSNIISKIPKEVIYEIKNIDLKIKQEDMLINMLSGVAVEIVERENQNLILANFMKNLKNNDGKTGRLPTELEVLMLETIQKYIKTKLKINLRMKQHDEYLSLEGNFKEINLNQENMEYLLQILDFVDTFAILPWYSSDEDDEELKGVRLFFAYQLKKEEE